MMLVPLFFLAIISTATSSSVLQRGTTPFLRQGLKTCSSPAFQRKFHGAAFFDANNKRSDDQRLVNVLFGGAGGAGLLASQTFFDAQNNKSIVKGEENVKKGEDKQSIVHAENKKTTSTSDSHDDTNDEGSIPDRVAADKNGPSECYATGSSVPVAYDGPSDNKPIRRGGAVPIVPKRRYCIFIESVCQSIEELREKREQLTGLILKEEEDKRKIQKELSILNDRLAKINASLARKTKARNENEKTLQEMDAAFMKILENSRTLLHAVNREDPLEKKKKGRSE